MRLTISGIHMETGDALQTYAEERVQGISKIFDQVIDVLVHFVQDTHHSHMRGAELTVMASGTLLRAEGAGPDWHTALDEAVSKLERQLDRYKGRLQKQRERQKKVSEQEKLAGPMSGIDFEDATLDDSVFDSDARAIEDEFGPAIIRKDVSHVAPMTVDEAIMQMDLLHKPAFLFKNAKSGQMNMVYREGDNTVRWIAPKTAQ